MGKIYLIYGDDEHLKDNALKKIKKSVNVENTINNILMYSPEWDEIQSEITLPSFFRDEKILICFNSLLFGVMTGKNVKKSNLKEEIEAAVSFLSKKGLEEMLSNLTLVFVEENISEKNSLFKLFVKESKNVDSKGDRNFEDNFKVIKAEKLNILDRAKYLLDLAKKAKLNIAYAEIKFLIDMVEDDTMVAVNELKKIMFLDKAKKGEKITIDDIKSVCIKTEDFKIYEISENLFLKQNDKAIEIADQFIKEGKEHMILGYIYKYMRDIYLTKIAIDEKVEDKLVQILKLTPNRKFLTKKYTSFAKRMGIKKLEFILNELEAIDFESKLEQINIGLRIKAVLKII